MYCLRHSRSSLRPRWRRLTARSCCSGSWIDSTVELPARRRDPSRGSPRPRTCCRRKRWTSSGYAAASRAQPGPRLRRRRSSRPTPHVDRPPLGPCQPGEPEPGQLARAARRGLDRAERRGWNGQARHRPSSVRRGGEHVAVLLEAPALPRPRAACSADPACLEPRSRKRTAVELGRRPGRPPAGQLASRLSRSDATAARRARASAGRAAAP